MTMPLDRSHITGDANDRKAAPWAITDFDVERYRGRLYRLHMTIKRSGGFSVKEQHRFLLPRKPASSISASELIRRRERLVAV